MSVILLQNAIFCVAIFKTRSGFLIIKDPTQHVVEEPSAGVLFWR